MKKLYFDRAKNRFCFEQKIPNTIPVQVDPHTAFHSVHEYYISNNGILWSYAYSTVAFNYEMVDWGRNAHMKQNGIDKEEFSLFRVVISKDAYDDILGG